MADERDLVDWADLAAWAGRESCREGWLAGYEDASRDVASIFYPEGGGRG